MRSATISSKGWRVNGIQGIIFDKDGTLTDAHPFWARIVERRALALQQHYSLKSGAVPELCSAMGLDLKNRRLLPEGPVGRASREEVMSAAMLQLQQLGVPAQAETMDRIFIAEHEAFFEEMLDYTVLLQGVDVLLKTLQECGIRMSLVTSDTKKNAWRILEHLGLKDLFQVVIGRESDLGPKTEGRPARAASAKMGLLEQDVIAVGDAPQDAFMAKNAGLKAVILTATGQAAMDTLLLHSAFVVPNLTVVKAMPEQTQ